LRAPQGALNAKDVQAELKIHLRELSTYEVEVNHGWLLRPFVGLDEQRGLWFGGPNYWRVVYTAGYATVPDDVQEACAQSVAALFWQTKRDPGLAHEAIHGAVTRTVQHGVPESIQVLLLPYRDARLLELGG